MWRPPLAPSTIGSSLRSADDPLAASRGGRVHLCNTTASPVMMHH